MDQWKHLPPKDARGEHEGPLFAGEAEVAGVIERRCAALLASPSRDPYVQCRLITRGRELFDLQTMGYYKIQERSYIHAMIGAKGSARVAADKATMGTRGEKLGKHPTEDLWLVLGRGQ